MWYECYVWWKSVSNHWPTDPEPTSWRADTATESENTPQLTNAKQKCHHKPNIGSNNHHFSKVNLIRECSIPPVRSSRPITTCDSPVAVTTGFLLIQLINESALPVCDGPEDDRLTYTDAHQRINKSSLINYFTDPQGEGQIIGATFNVLLCNFPDVEDNLSHYESCVSTHWSVKCQSERPLITVMWSVSNYVGELKQRSIRTGRKTNAERALKNITFLSFLQYQSDPVIVIYTFMFTLQTGNANS